MTGRTRQRLGEDVRRAQILAATVAVVAESGYEGASLARIAERADVSKGLVSHYFTDKDGLLAAAAQATLTALRDAIAAEVPLSEPVPEIIRSAVRQVSDLPATHGAELSALRQIVANLRGPDGTPRFSINDYEETYRAQETLFRRGQAEGTLRPFDTRVMAVSYQGALDSMLGYLDANPDVDRHAYADALTDLLVAAMT